MKLYALASRYSPMVLVISSIKYDSSSRSIFISDVAGDRYIIKNIDSVSGKRLIKEVFNCDKLELSDDMFIERVI